MLSNHYKFPIENYESHILLSLKKFRILIIVGETGSGKTTIVPKILYKHKFFNKIVISQTKRIAAVNAAIYLSKILNFTIGKEVGYSVRFDNRSTINTRIKFVTDGILFKEVSEDTTLSLYKCVIIDEFHERTIYTDLLLSILKKILIKRKDFHLIIMSASGECDKIAKFFNMSAVKLNIPGRLFDIKIYFSKFPQSNYIASITALIIKCHFEEHISGNFLVFLPGQEEILKIKSQLNFFMRKKLSNFIVIKFYSGLSNEDYLNIFKNVHVGKRKIILATNIAESSITIPGISLVIDSGFSKQKIKNWKNGIDLFRIFPISKSEAHQRAGRAGREQIGKCFRIYTFVDFCRFRSYSKPEIQRTDLTSIILILYSYNVKYFFSLDFITLPPIWSIYRCFEKLFIYGIITDKLKITYLGKLCSVFPLDVNMSVTIIEALKKKNQILLNLISGAISVLSTNMMVFNNKNIFCLSNDFRKVKFMGDHFYYAILFYQYQTKKNNQNLKSWYQKKNLNENCFNLAISVNIQIKEICFSLIPYLDFQKFVNIPIQLNLNEQFKFCITAGYFLNTARFIKFSKKFHSICYGLLVDIYPLSLYNTIYPKLIIFHEFLVTSKPFISGVMPTKFEWLSFLGIKIFI